MSTRAFRGPGICRNPTHPLERVKGRGADSLGMASQHLRRGRGLGIAWDRDKGSRCVPWLLPLHVLTGAGHSPAWSRLLQRPGHPAASCLLQPGTVSSWTGAPAGATGRPVPCRAERARPGVRAGSDAQHVERAQEDGLAPS